MQLLFVAYAIEGRAGQLRAQMGMLRAQMGKLRLNLVHLGASMSQVVAQMGQNGLDFLSCIAFTTLNHYSNLMVSSTLAPLYTVFGLKLGCSGAAAPIGDEVL